MRRLAVLCALLSVAAASYDNPSDPSPDGVQAFNPENAPDPVCGANEEYTQCATHCEPTCANPNPVCIRSCAPAQCQCVYGYLRNDAGECIAAVACPAAAAAAAPAPEPETEQEQQPEEAQVEPAQEPEETTTESYTPAVQEEEETTTQGVVYMPAPLEYNNTVPAAPVAEEPATDAPAPVEEGYAAQETPAPAASASGEYPSSSSSSLSSNDINDVAPTPEEEDVVVVGGACSEDTCRVGYKCDDSTAVGAKCIPYDTRARSSCAAIRCRPGWSCVIAMDGPRCYRNSVLGITDAPVAPAAASSGSYSSDYAAAAPAADEPAAAAAEPSKKTCAETTCPQGLTCFEDSTFPDPFCRSSTSGSSSAPQACSELECGPGETCKDEYHGPICARNGPQVFPGKTCATTECDTMHQCFDTVDGASCYPIPTDPVDNTVRTCSDISCGEGETCKEEETGAICAAADAAPEVSDPVPVAAPEIQDRDGSASDCEHMQCESGEMCAIDFEGVAYCRPDVAAPAADAAEAAPQADEPSAPSPIPVCADITCPNQHECVEDEVRGAACWPVTETEPVSSAPVEVVASLDEEKGCKKMPCTEDEICVEESSGPRCVPTQRRGVAAPGYRRRY